MAVKKQDLAELLDDMQYLPEYRRGLGYRQLMRKTVRQLEEDLAQRLMTHWQQRASYARSWAARYERRGKDELALDALYRMDAELTARSDEPVEGGW